MVIQHFLYVILLTALIFLSKDLANTSVVCSVLGEAKEVFELC
jgi:hypothetical protein